MQHFFDFINKNEIGRLLGSKLIVTVKEDGTPLTAKRNENGFEFFKKGSSFIKCGLPVSPIDRFLNEGYGEPFTYLQNIMKENFSKLNTADIFNFEIVVENNFHLIKPKVFPENNVYFLNAFKGINEIGLPEENNIAALLKISQPEKLMEGIVNSDFLKKLNSLVKDYDSPVEKHDDVNDIVSKFISIIPENMKVNFNDQNEGNHEGIVFDFYKGNKHTFLKIDDHIFTNDMIERNESNTESNGKEYFENLVNAFCEIVTAKNYYYTLRKYSTNPLDNLVINFDKTFGRFFQGYKYISSVYKKGDEILTYINKDLLSDDIKDKINDPDYLIALRCFIWIFSKKRKDMKKQNILFDKVNYPRAKDSWACKSPS